MQFLTDQDPRGRVKGSRDPLGFEVIWSTFGRKIVGNLTTVTSSLEAFATCLLGHYYANVFAEPGAGEDLVCKNFLRFEQVAAYSLLHYEQKKLVASRPAILGIQRANQRFQESRSTPVVGAGRECQILANQRAYGTWGLYSTALRETGFLKPGSHTLSKEGTALCEKCWRPKLPAVEEELKALVKAGGTFAATGKHEKIALALAEALLQRDEQTVQQFYLPLATGGKAGKAACQQTFFEFLTRKEIRDLGTRDAVEAAIKAVGPASGLHGLLTDCREVEKVLSCCQAMFSFLLTRHGAGLDEIAGDISAKRYDFSFLGSALSESRISRINSITGEVKTGSMLASVQRLLQTEDFKGAVGELLALNEKVMRIRGGDAWARNEQGRLKVKYLYEKGDLPESGEIGSLWYNSYFINSLRSFASALAA